MLRVKFNDKQSMQDVNFKLITPSVVQLTGKNVLRNTTGFNMYRLNGDFLGNYSEFTEIVGEVKDGFRFGVPDK